jgi:hypothetical protein
MKQMMTGGMVASTALALALGAWAAGEGEAVKIEYKVKKDMSWKQKVSMKGDGTIDVAGNSIDMKMDIVQAVTNKVTDVQDDGTFTLEVNQKTETMKVTVMGAEAPLPPDATADQKVTAKLTKFGKPVDIKGVKIKSDQFDPTKLLQMAGNPLPEKPVKVGDTWEAEFKDKLEGLKLKGKLLGVKKVDGKQMAEIEYSMGISGTALGKLIKEAAKETAPVEIEVGGAGMKGTMTTLIDLATGIQHKGTGKFDMDMEIKAAGQEIKMKMKMDVTQDPETL